MFHVMQADASALQQELQELQSSTAEARQQMQADTTGLQGHLQTALAECVKASQGQGQLQTALKNSRNAHQQMQADVTGLQGQLQTALAGCKIPLHKKKPAHADSHKEISNPMGQLATAADAHAVADSAQSDAKKPQKQLSGAVISFDLHTKKLQQQLTEAQAAVESAQAGTGKVLQQQRTELQARIEQSNKLSVAAHHVELLAKVPISPSDCAEMLWMLQPLPCNLNYHQRLYLLP